MEWCFTFQWGEGGGCFPDVGGFICKWGESFKGGIGFDGDGESFEKNRPPPMSLPTMGNPGTSKPISMKLATCMYHLNTFHVPKTEGCELEGSSEAHKKKPLKMP